MDTQSNSGWSALLDAQATRWLKRSSWNPLNSDGHRFRVWLVDDSEQNRADVYNGQKHHFDIETFSTPAELLYAYTSKGPYLLHGEGFQRLEELETRWLFRGQLDALHVRHRLETDIRELRDQQDWRRWTWQVALKVGLVGAVFAVLIDRILTYVFRW